MILYFSEGFQLKIAQFPLGRAFLPRKRHIFGQKSAKIGHFKDFLGHNRALNRKFSKSQREKALYSKKQTKNYQKIVLSVPVRWGSPLLRLL